MGLTRTMQSVFKATAALVPLGLLAVLSGLFSAAASPTGMIAGQPARPASPTSISAPAPNASEAWQLDRIRAPQALQENPFQPGLTIAVLDTGVDAAHPWLAGRVSAASNFSSSPETVDHNGHGTYVAGIIAQSLGIESAAASYSLLNVKVARDDGFCDAVVTARGIIFATDAGARVINLSLALGAPSPELVSAIDYAWGKGAVIVAAAGNGFSTAPSYPAALPHVVGVAATDKADRMAVWSNRGDWVTVAAPGVSVVSSLPGASFGSRDGTSAAAAFVTARPPSFSGSPATAMATDG